MSHKEKTRLVYCRCFGKVAFLENLKFGEMLPSLHGVFQADARINPMKPTVFVILFHPSHPKHRISLSQKHSSQKKKKKLYHLKTDRWRSPLPLYRLGLSWRPYKSSPKGSGATAIYLHTPEFSSSCSCATCAACCCKADGFGAGSTMSTCGNAKALYLLQKMVDDRGNLGNICIYIYIIKGCIIYLGICIYEYKYR